MSQHGSDLLTNVYHFIPIDFYSNIQYSNIVDSHVKISGRNYWYARFWQKLLKFLQGETVE